MTYEESIDALIPEAEKIANERVRQIGKKWNPRKGPDGKIFRYDYFTFEFHKAMNRLAAEKGLR
jgi:hypothetical protein